MYGEIFFYSKSFMYNIPYQWKRVFFLTILKIKYKFDHHITIKFAIIKKNILKCY